MHQEYKKTTFLSMQDQEIWFDEILFPCMNKAVASSNKKQHFPASKRVADLNATASSKEGFKVKYSLRIQSLYHPIQHANLELLWLLICEKINEAVAVAADSPAARFADPLLFMSDKNSKMQYMADGQAKDILKLLPRAYKGWLKTWKNGTDERFYSKNDTFIDIAKQTTSLDSTIPFEPLPLHHDKEAEVYLWRNCCLKSYLQERHRHCHRKGEGIGVATYPFATFGDAGAMTISSPVDSCAYKTGLIYSQFYGLIKISFDAAKVYIFNNEALENIALDPGYVQTLKQAGKGVAFSQKTCEISYLHSKARANANFLDNQWRSYGTREEHRVSMAVAERIIEHWEQWQRQKQEQHGGSGDDMEDIYSANDGDDIEPQVVAPLPIRSPSAPLPLPLPPPLPYCKAPFVASRLQL
jgi:hypothetical protein